MIYDSVIFTGESSLSGCSSDFFHTDNFLELNREAVGSAGLFYYDRANSTGDKRLQLSLNSQTLLQEVPITGQAANEISYQINTGDYFVKGTEADIIDINRVFFHNTVPAKSTSNILYKVKKFTLVMVLGLKPPLLKLPCLIILLRLMVLSQQITNQILFTQLTKNDLDLTQ